MNNVPDSLVAPYLCATDSQGALWVVSTNTTNAKAENSLFKAAPGDETMTLVKVFGAGDSVRNISGITAIGADIFVSARMSAPAGEASPAYYPYSQMFYFPNGDASKMEIFKKPGSWDYGTWYSAIAATKDGYIYFGQSYLVTLGTIDGRKDSSTFGNTIDYARIDWGTAMEPGGGLTNPNVIDLIRDAAVIPDADYNDTTSIIYTSRNSSSDPGGESVGGIAAWKGGSQSAPLNYKAARITDLSGFLTLKNAAPYGIAVHPAKKYLYVCGTDTTKKWVKGFQIVDNFAIQIDELPSSSSADVKDAHGAPFAAPADVAFNGNGSIAYVADETAKKIFKFELRLIGVAEEPDLTVKDFSVAQNYPNPFNPSTIINVNVKAPARLKAEVYNSLGQKVAVLIDKEVSSGLYALHFDGSSLASGIYFCNVAAGVSSKTIKMILNK